MSEIISQNLNESKKKLILSDNDEESSDSEPVKIDPTLSDGDPEQSENQKKKKNPESEILENPVAFPLWLSVSEAAKLGGVNTKTIRRAIQAEKIRYTIHKDRYLVGFRSLIRFLYSNTKLKNKLNFNGIGQYIKEWR